MNLEIVIVISLATGYALGATRQWRSDLVARAAAVRWWR